MQSRREWTSIEGPAWNTRGGDGESLWNFHRQWNAFKPTNISLSRVMELTHNETVYNEHKCSTGNINSWATNLNKAVYTSHIIIIASWSSVM